MNNSQSENLRKTQINNNENLALNVMVSFLEIAQKRGAFILEEAAKIYECIKVFKPDLSKKVSKNSVENAPKKYNSAAVEAAAAAATYGVNK